MKTLDCFAQCAGISGASAVSSGQRARLREGSHQMGTCNLCPSEKDAQWRRELMHVNEGILHTGTLEAHSPLSWCARLAVYLSLSEEMDGVGVPCL